MSGIDSDEELWRRWLTSEPVRRFESGLGTDEQFAAPLGEEWRAPRVGGGVARECFGGGLPMSAEELLEMFPGWLVGAYDGAVELVREAAARTRVACFSNSNRLH